MRRLLLLTLLAAIPAVAHDHGSHRNHDGSTSMWFDDHDGAAVTCNDLNVTFDGQRAEVTTETVAVRGNRLRIVSSQNGGIRVIGADDGNWNVQACKAVAPGSNGSARVSYNGSELTADTSEDKAMVYFIVRAPRGASIDALANNGPITVNGVDGTITARATNGPVSVKESNGTIDASTVNGPIAFSGGGSGKVKLSAQNGPLAVKLDGSSWNGSLDASTENGPVSVRLPRNFGSRVVVEATGHGPISCKADACGDRKGTRILDDNEDGDRSRRFEFGTGAETVHITAGNGPLTIRDRD